MPDDDLQQVWRSDYERLARVGSALSGADYRIKVQIPKDLARVALDAWRRSDDGPARDESCQDRAERRGAAALALIGLAVKQEGRWLDSSVEVSLDPWLVGIALEAADDRGLLEQGLLARAEAQTAVPRFKPGSEHLFELTVDELEAWAALFIRDLRDRFGNRLRLTKDYYFQLAREDRYEYPEPDEWLAGQYSFTIDSLRTTAEDLEGFVIPMMLEWYSDILRAIADEEVESAPES